MKSSYVAAATALLFFHTLASTHCQAQEASARSLRFQRPSQATQGRRANLKFRSPAEERSRAKNPQAKRVVEIERVSHEQTASRTKLRKKKSADAPQRKKVVSEKPATSTRVARHKKVIRRDQQVEPAADEIVEFLPEPQAVPEPQADSPMVYEEEGPVFEEGPMLYDEGPMAYDEGPVGCGSCAQCVGQPGLGFSDPGCGFADPSCGLEEPGCGIGDPSCGLGTTRCGSGVGRPGSDYWCVPVCLPRFKDLSVWGGVQGFRGPRDFSNGRSDSNFGFTEGINISGRAPLLGLLFPQLSSQLGYQAVQSRLSGTVDSPDDRSQQFVTAGLFRRVDSGLQFGVAWDLLRDDLDEEVDYQQIRTEFSLKSPQGREFGFWSATSVDDGTVLGQVYETVDQYALFCRWNFGKNYECRFWGGVTGNDDGIFGGEFTAPLSNRWMLQSGFNYLITDQSPGPEGVQEEAWNIGINLVWHMGRTARSGSRSPYRPLFSVANNGWMIVDHASP